MDVLTRDSEFINCPHCDHQIRRGMIRCRECNGVVSEDFVLSDNVAANVSAVRRCNRCNAPLDPGVDDCPSCASMMLDQLLQAPPPPVEAEAPRRFGAPAAGLAESRLRPPPSLPPAEPKRSAKKRGRAAERQRADGDEEAGTDALYESETNSRVNSSSRTVSDFERITPAAAAEPPEPAASEACQSLIAALATPDPNALYSVVTALGQLGDRSALGPIERLMGNPEIRVRRAAAEALILLGHPKGDNLLEIAERRVAANPPPPTRSGGYSKARKNRNPTDWGAVLKPGLALLTVAMLGGGIWWWQSRPLSTTAKMPAKKGSKKTDPYANRQAAPAAVQPTAAPAGRPPNATYDYNDP